MTSPSTTANEATAGPPPYYYDYDNEVDTTAQETSTDPAVVTSAVIPIAVDHNGAIDPKTSISFPVIATAIAASVGAVSMVVIATIIFFCTKKRARKSNDDADALPSPITSPDDIVFETGQDDTAYNPSFLVPPMGPPLSSPNDIVLHMVPTLSPTPLQFGDASTNGIRIELEDNEYTDSQAMENEYAHSPGKFITKELQPHLQRNLNGQFDGMYIPPPSKPYSLYADVDNLESYIDDAQ